MAEVLALTTIADSMYSAIGQEILHFNVSISFEGTINWECHFDHKDSAAFSSQQS